MQTIHFHGSYRYDDPAKLESALQHVREHLHIPNEELWFRCFVTDGSVLTVNLQVPSSPSRILDAASVFLHLSRGALEGAFAAS